MALNPKRTDEAANAACDAHAALLNTGYLRIYDGTQPTDAGTAIGAQVLLAGPATGSGRHDLRAGRPERGIRPAGRAVVWIAHVVAVPQVRTLPVRGAQGEAPTIGPDAVEVGGTVAEAEE